MLKAAGGAPPTKVLRAILDPPRRVMSTIDRRAFLRASGATLAAAAWANAPAAEPPAGRLKKAFMLGGVTKGPILPTFELLKRAGFEGVELISPNHFDRDEVLRARDQTGLVIHGVSGAVHWRDTLSDPN